MRLEHDAFVAEAAEPLAAYERANDPLGRQAFIRQGKALLLAERQLLEATRDWG